MNSNDIESRRENKGYSSSPCGVCAFFACDGTVMELFSECVWDSFPADGHMSLNGEHFIMLNDLYHLMLCYAFIPKYSCL